MIVGILHGDRKTWGPYIPFVTNRNVLHSVSKMIFPKSTEEENARTLAYKYPLHYLMLSLHKEPRKSMFLLCRKYSILSFSNYFVDVYQIKKVTLGLEKNAEPKALFCLQGA